jgi:hypothetical protein
MTLRSSSGSNNQSEDDEAQNDHYLHARKPELELSEYSNSEVVNCNNCDKEECDVDRQMARRSGIPSLIKPVLDN